MKDKFLKELMKLEKSSQVDRKVYEIFKKRISLGEGLIKATNPADHIGTFFLPLHLPSKSVYLGHHIKANSWIPPGGHIKPEETPLDTVYREFEEELSHKLTDENIELFDLSIVHVRNPGSQCRIHYDMWYLVYTDRLPFTFEKKEFHDARWVPIVEAASLVTHPVYVPVIKKINRSIISRHS